MACNHTTDFVSTAENQCHNKPTKKRYACSTCGNMFIAYPVFIVRLSDRKEYYLGHRLPTHQPKIREETMMKRSCKICACIEVCAIERDLYDLLNRNPALTILRDERHLDENTTGSTLDIYAAVARACLKFRKGREA